MASDEVNPKGVANKDDPIIPESIEYEFVTDSAYKPVFANGVFGGIGPYGDLTMHFFQEQNSIPKLVTHKVNEDGALGEEIARVPASSTNPAKLVRYITCGAVMDEAMARRLYKWLGQKLAQYDASHEKAD